MIEPPIDEMVKIVDGNKYKLCCLMAKRAKQIFKSLSNELETSDKKEITIAAEEIHQKLILSSDSEEAKKRGLNAN